MHRSLFLALCLGVVTLCGIAVAQSTVPFATPQDAAQALAAARTQQAEAGKRAEALERAAREAVAAADKTAQESAAVAARIQQAEATIAGNQARLAIIAGQRTALRDRLATHQQPLVRLTAALQRLSRRPPALSLLRPGSLQDSVYLRAVLQTMLPEVQRRTAGLRSEIDRARTLETRALAANADLRASETEFARRRQTLAALETQQRLASRQASGIADRETERALALAEQARDLGGLVGELSKQGVLRDELASLAGPVLRPALPAAAQVGIAGEARPGVPVAAPPPPGYRLPVAGRLVQGFGAVSPGKPHARGISLATNPSAQAVAPAAGRVVFAGPYASYGQIVIIEHPGGWTSVITGLGELDTRVGQQLVAGSPLGLAGPGRPIVSLELRKAGEPVNPLDLAAP